MPFEIRPPKIDASDSMRQLAQVKSFLIQLVEQLNIALRTLEGGSAASSKAEEGAGAKKDSSNAATPIAFNEIKTLIIKSNDIINAYYRKMRPMIDEVLKDGIDNHNTSEEAHADIRKLIEELENGGGGPSGADGVSPTVEVSKTGSVTTITITDVNGTKTATINDGDKGADGYTPVKGTDYYTEADKAEMVNRVLAALPIYTGEVESV